MKPFLFLLLAILILAGSTLSSRTGQTQAAPAVQGGCSCIGVRYIRGENCGTRDSFRVEFQNGCPSAVNAQVFVRWTPYEGWQPAGRPIFLRPGDQGWYFWCRTPYQVIIGC